MYVYDDRCVAKRVLKTKTEHDKRELSRGKKVKKKIQWQFRRQFVEKSRRNTQKQNNVAMTS